MLFIDEAYALRAEGSSDSAGQECVNTLVKESEDHTNDLVIILAGYNKEMASFVSSNSGLASRFPNVFNFADYSHEEMAGILRSVAVEKVTRATLPKSASCRRAHPAEERILPHSFFLPLLLLPLLRPYAYPCPLTSISTPSHDGHRASRSRTTSRRRRSSPWSSAASRRERRPRATAG